jgi:hypothetical protein
VLVVLVFLCFNFVLGGSPGQRRKGSESAKDGFDQKALKQAKELLHANNQREAAAALAAVKAANEKELKKNANAGMAKNDAWTPGGSGRNSSASVASSINPGSSVSQNFSPSVPVQTQSMRPVGPLIAPLLPTPQMNPHNTFVPTAGYGGAGRSNSIQGIGCELMVRGVVWSAIRRVSIECCSAVRW